MEKVIVIVGPTGVGKTSLSVEIAKQFNGEIISGDAYQVYKKMDVGTAKVTKEETQNILHHLVDVFDIGEDYNVKIFQEKGREIIKDIINRKKTPIVCGGTGLYIKALLYDYLFNEEVLDEAYQKELQELSNEDLYERLKRIDAKACETLHHNNRKRVIRALMMAHNGEKKSERLEKQEHKLLYDAYIIGLTMERDQLYERINQRVDIMMQDGLYEEVKNLVDSKEVFNLQSMRAIGYKEWEDHFYGSSTKDEIVDKIKKNSRNFAKRQYTWFHNQMEVHWYDVAQEKAKKKILEDTQAFLEGEK